MPTSEKQTPEEWKRVKDALNEALDVPEVDRPTVLQRCLGDDPTLHLNAKSYLGLDDQIGNFIEQPAMSLSPRVLKDPMLGRRVGPYKLERLLGRGGMGSVYLAIREDDYEKQVAIKLMHQALSTGEMVERFRKERQILAHLEHPNIARLLDGGATDEGLPFLVMEYVEGLPIDQYCDGHRLSVRRRLELFRQVCSAVHFAHRNLVVHRDLKPGNILVDGDGVPKLLDFGIAKLLGSESVTQMADREVGPMTYQYASPEQVLGDPITTTSDVYSLGILLYEILSGHLPFKREQYQHPLGIMKAVGTKEPPKPSTAIWREEKLRRSTARVRVTVDTVSQARQCEASKLHRQLTGDLDAIVLKALRREPEHRYGSVEQLTDDVRRYLEGRPVEARAGTFLYLAGKFIRRYRIALFTGMVFLAVVISFMIMLTRERDEADMERERAVMSMDLLVEFLENPELSDDEELTVEWVVARGVEMFGEDLLRDKEAQANALSHLGLIYSYRGLYDKSQMLLEGALKLRREQSGDSDEQVAETLLNLAHLLNLRRDHQAAESLAREAVDLLRNNQGPPRVLAKGIANLASYLRSLGRREEALKLYFEALSMKEDIYGADHPALASTMGNIGTLFYRQGDFEEAQRYYERALDTRLKYLPENHRRLAVSYQQVGTVLTMLGVYSDAVTMFRNALRIHRDRLGSEHPDVAGAQNNLAFTLERIGELDEAEDLYRSALKIRQANFEDKSTGVATIERNLASLLLAKGEAKAAEALVRKALGSFLSLEGETFWRVADARSVLGSCLGVQGKFAEAESFLIQGFEALRETTGHERYKLDARNRVARFYVDQGRSDLAQKYQ